VEGQRIMAITFRPLIQRGFVCIIKLRVQMSEAVTHLREERVNESPVLGDLHNSVCTVLFSVSLLLYSLFTSSFIFLSSFVKDSFTFRLTCFVPLSPLFFDLSFHLQYVFCLPVIFVLLSFAILLGYFFFVNYIFSYVLVPSSIFPCPFFLSSVPFPHHWFSLPSYFLPSCFSFLFFTHSYISVLVSFLPCFTFST
jgi:hypothetical protein